MLQATVTDDATGKTATSTLDALELLSSASASIPAGDGQKQAEFLTESLHAALRKHWRFAVDNRRLDSPINPSGSPDQNSVFTLLFVRRMSGELPEIFEIKFPFRELPRAGGGWANYLDPPSLLKLDPNSNTARAQGSTQCLRLPDDPAVLNSRSTLVGAIELIYERASQLASPCKDLIGGPVDIAVIDNSGFQWLRKKR